jgi:hypothetical protein
MRRAPADPSGGGERGMSWCPGPPRAGGLPGGHHERSSPRGVAAVWAARTHRGTSPSGRARGGSHPKRSPVQTRRGEDAGEGGGGGSGVRERALRG